MKKLILLFALMVLSYEATLAQCPTVCATNRTTTINLDVQPVCTTGTFATIGGEITNNNNNCNDNNNISCHRFILTRGAFSTITGISADVGQGANCNGDITVAYSNINGVCQQIATAGSQTNLTINFPSTLNPDGSWAVTQISVYICKNSSSLMTFCNLCVVSLCDINITCPASTNLGAYNCNNQAPALPTTITQITSAPYNFVIPTVPSSCGVLRVIATDSPSPNYCTTTTQTITRNIRVYLDANNNSNFDVGEQSSPLCPFTYTIQARPAPNVTCPAPVSMAACASQSAINTAYASWLAGFQATGGCGNITTTNLSAFQTAPSACANQNITVTINYSATDNCSTATCTSTFTVLAQPALSVNCPAPVTMTACASQAAINTAYAAWLAGFQTTGGCSPTSTNLTAFQTPPSACATQDVTVTINYTATDDCNTAACSSTFTVLAQSALSVSCPAPVSMAACASQSAINTSYAAWLSGFQVTSGCNVTSTDLSGFQTPPSACAAQDVTVTINFTATDDCNNSTSCSSTFTVAAQPALSVSCPAPASMTACASQTAINTAYATWLAGFQTSGGCSPTSTNLAAFQTPPSACANQNVTVTINYAATDDCNTASCSSTFTIAAQPALSVSCPAPVSLTACASQTAINTAYATWLAGFQTTGGCSPTSTNLTAFQTPPSACANQDVTVTINYTATDDCNTAVCSSTFTVLAQSALSVSCPAPVSITACASQSAINTAYATWLSGFQVTSGCNVTSTDLSGFQTPPSACATQDVTVTINFTATDDCNNSTSCSSTFTIAAQPALSVSCPAPVSMAACASQSVINTAYATWLAGFQTSGGCSPTSTNLAAFQTPPSACANQNVTVTINYTATDDCNTASCSSTFTIAAQPALSVSCPAPVTMAACASQSEIIIAYAAWLAGFQTTGGCNTISTDLSAYQTSPSACANQDIIVTINYAASDDCNAVTCGSTFTVLAQPVLSTNCPNDVTMTSCNSQAQINAAFAQWQAQFTFSGGCGSSGQFLQPYTAPSFCGGTTTVTYTAIDNCGQTVSCTKIFRVMSAPQLVINCPAPIAVDACQPRANIEAAFANWMNSFSASGGCNATGAFVQNYTAPSTCGSTLIVSYQATDNCGNFTTCNSSFSLVVNGDISSVVAQPAQNLTVACNSNNQQQLINWLNNHGGAIASNSCGQVTWTNNFAGFNYTCGSAGSVTVTFTATNACGYASTTTATFSVVDNTPPVLFGMPAALPDLPCNGTFPSPPLVTAVDNCSTATVAFSVDPFVVNVCQGYSVTYRWIATDACGNTAQVTRSFNVLPDTQAPVLSAVNPDLANIPNGGVVTVECHNSDPNWNPFIFGAEDMHATDNCSAVEITMTDELIEVGECGVSDFISRWRCTWTATDACGNVATYSFIMQIVDTSLPAFDALPPASLSVSCDHIPAAGLLSATDNCSQAIVSVSDTEIPGTCPGNFTIIRTWTATDGCGNTTTYSQTIQVFDNTAPVIYVVNDQLQSYSNGQTIDVVCDQLQTLLYDVNDVMAIDQCGKTRITYDIEFNPSGGCAQTGYMEIATSTWTATDECGNASSFVLHFRVIDQTPPVLQNVPDDLCLEAIPPASNDVFATDNCSSVSLTHSDSGPVYCNDGSYHIIRTWIAVDECGNESTDSQTIVIGDHNGPQITINSPLFQGLPDSSEVTVESSFGAQFGFVEPLQAVISATDGCNVNGDIETSVQVLQTGDCQADGFLYKLLYTIKATDACGNESSLIYIVTVVDSTAPIFRTANNITIGCTDEIPLPMVQDNSNLPVDITYIDQVIPPASYCEGDEPIVRQWIATDDCGNTSSIIQEIYIVDNEGPVLMGLPADGCGLAGPAPQVIAVDECSNDTLQVLFDEEIVTTPCGQAVVRTWLAQDNCGNVTSQTQTIYNNDNTAPTIQPAHPQLTGIVNGGTVEISCLDSSYPEELPDFGPDAMSTVDNCGGDVTVTFSSTLLDQGDCQNTGYVARYRYTWLAIDPCGNSATYSIIVKMVDEQAPFLVNVPGDLALYCDAEVPAQANVVAVEDCFLEDLIYNEQVNQLSSVEKHIIRTWTATDVCGNQSVASQLIKVYQPEFNCTIIAPDQVPCGSTNNQVSAQVSGGTGPYDYNWDVVDCDGFISGGQGTGTITYVTGFTTMNFLLTVTDANGCSSICTVSIPCEKQDIGLVLNEGLDRSETLQTMPSEKAAAQPGIIIFPNPATNIVQIQVEAFVGIPVNVQLFDATGNIHKTANFGSMPENGVRLELDDCPSGFYFVVIENEKQHIRIIKKMVIQRM